MSRLSLLALALLPGCSTLINGSNQAVSVVTAPPGASCTFDRNGERLGTIGLTPGNLTVSKSKNDLLVTCDKPGYQQVRLVQPPRFVPTTFGNLLAGGVVGIVVDASSGANYVYPAEVRLDLSTVGAPVAASTPSVVPATPASSFAGS